ncbi:MAG: hypothetical protein H7Y17_08655 [Chlorobia bacterium]|nr:hypothetical protein [Fimbriimonadaceae bacterium]
MDPLSLLERKDKWFLGGGKGAIYAPPFPRWLEKPGFWDESYFADIRLTRLFTVLFCDSSGRPVKLKGEFISWRPDRMVFEHRSSSHVIRETRLVTEKHEWVSALDMISGDGPLSAFVWSLPEMKEPCHGAPWQSLTSCEVQDGFISYEFATSWPSELEPDRTGVDVEQIPNRAVQQSSNQAIGMLPPVTLNITLSANQPRLSHAVNLAQRHDDAPLWEASLLPQKLREGILPGDFKLLVGPPPVEGLVHILQQYELKPGEPLVVSCRAEVADSESSIVNGKSSIGPEVVQQSEQDWRDYFASVPKFSSSDPYLTNAYWYRWYGLRLNTVDIPNLPICRTNPYKPEQNQTFSAFITEGIGFFRNFVTYSAQAHLREVAWMHSPRIAIGILENLAKCQREDGSFPGHNYSCRPARDFYHADFATGARNTEALHGELAKGTNSSLNQYSLFLSHNRHLGDDDEADSEARRGEPWWWMTVVLDQNETGQEYMSRYQAASHYADQWQALRIGGTDATTYALLLSEYLAEKMPGESLPGYISWWWGDEQQTLEYSLTEASWDQESETFKDLLPGGERSPALPATVFYPFLQSFSYASWLKRGSSDPFPWAMAINRWFLNPNEFWLPKGFPATALSDPTFSADAEWKDKRLNCPWNGRSWPMVNSHLVDAIANVARALRYSRTSFPSETDLGLKSGEALMKAITLMFHEGDPARPNSYEHYDPFTGTPSLYRGYDDYMHSWIVDLIMRHAVGVKPGEDDIDPLPLGVNWIECTDIPHPSGRMHVRIENDVVVRCEVVES